MAPTATSTTRTGGLTPHIRAAVDVPRCVPPNTTRSLAAKAAALPFAPLPNARARLWGNGERPCRIGAGSEWRFLAHGGKHFLFRTALECEGTAPTSVLVRFETKLTIHNRKPGERRNRLVYRYVSTSRNASSFFQQLQGNWTSGEFDDYFVRQIGDVEVPCGFVQDPDNVPLRDTKVGGVSSLTGCDTAGPAGTILAQLYHLVPGVPLRKWGWHLKSANPRLNACLLEETDASRERKRQIARNLVYLTRHMYRQRVMHCDWHLNHLIVEETGDGRIKTRMIDFEKVRILDPDNIGSVAVNFLKQQLLQLLGLLGNICGAATGVDEYPVHANACGKDRWDEEGYKYGTRETFVRRALSQTKGCEFGAPLKWRPSMMNATQLAYRALSTWVGLSE